MKKKNIHIKSFAKHLRLFCINMFLLFIAISLYKCSNINETNQFHKIKAYPHNLDETTYPQIVIQNIIQLETKEKSLFAEITKLESYGKYLYIFDETITKCLYVFNNNGAFINKIKKGKGPGELIFPTDFYIDTISKEICVIDDADYMYYDLLGNLKRNEEMLPYHFVMKAEMLNKTEFISFNGNPVPSDLIGANEEEKLALKNKMYSVVILDKKEALEIRKFFPVSYIESQLTRNKPTSNFNDNIYCLEGGWSNKIYRLTEDKQFAPAFEVDFGDKNITNEERKKDWSIGIGLTKTGKRMGHIDNLFVTDKFISFSYFGDDDNSPCIHSFKHNLSYSLPRILEHNNLPKATPLKFIGDDVLLCAIYPEDYLDFINHNKNSRLEELNLKLNPEDNPIIIEIKIKYK